MAEKLTIEERRKIRGEKARLKRQELNRKQREKKNSPEVKKREAEKRKRELSAINNTSVENKVKKKNKENSDKKSTQVGMSKQNKKWEQKRINRYNERVWKGWNRQEKSSEVTTYHISELEEKNK